MVVRNAVDFGEFVWIPPQHVPSWKVTVTRLDGTIDDITDLLIASSWTFGATVTIGNFEFTIPNPNQLYSSVWSGMEVVTLYKDYAAAATTARFTGRVEKVSPTEGNIRVSGRGQALFAFETTVTKQYVAVDSGVLIADLFNTYCPGRYTSTNLNTSTGVLVTVSWNQQPFWNCVQEVCLSAGTDCYIDASLDIHYFLKNTVLNATEALVHDYNLIEVGDFYPDIQKVRNKVKIYGAVIDGIQIVYTTQASADNLALYGTRLLSINDNSITTDDAAKAKGDFLLAYYQNAPIVGDVMGLLLGTLQPGDNIYLSSESDNLPPNAYRIITYTDTIGADGVYTKVNIEREPVQVFHLIVSGIQTQDASFIGALNPADLDTSYSFLFDTDTGTHSSTQIVNGILKPTAGTGNWTSPTKATASNVTQVYVIPVGQFQESVSVQVSANNGVSFETIPFKTLTNLTVSVGQQLIVKVLFTSANANLDSLSVLYNTA